MTNVHAHSVPEKFLSAVTSVRPTGGGGGGGGGGLGVVGCRRDRVQKCVDIWIMISGFSGPLITGFRLHIFKDRN